MFKIFKKKKNAPRFTFFNIGFHGDKYLLKLVDFLMKDCEVFIETGTNVGSTLAYVARTYPNISCISCEPDIEAYSYAKVNTGNYSNVEIYNKTSQEFLNLILEKEPDIVDKRVLFWLDAHGYGFEWPLQFEIDFITKNFMNALILIDDFKVPDFDCFGYDNYENYICSYDFIKDYIKWQNYNLIYPNYTERTSKHHPLQGWGLLHNKRNLTFSQEINDFIKIIHKKKEKIDV